MPRGPGLKLNAIKRGARARPATRAVDLSEVDLAFGFSQGTRRLVVTVTPKKRRRHQGHRPGDCSDRLPRCHVHDSLT